MALAFGPLAGGNRIKLGIKVQGQGSNAMLRTTGLTILIPQDWDFNRRMGHFCGNSPRFGSIEARAGVKQLGMNQKLQRRGRGGAENAEKNKGAFGCVGQKRASFARDDKIRRSLQERHAQK